MDGIVIGVDESESAACALRWGVAYAELHRRPATALMAWSYRDQHPFEPNATFDVDYGRHEACRDLDVIIERALGAPHPAVRRRAACGVAADELLSASHGADLMVIGARGMGGFRGLLLGSVSRGVLYGSASPVAVIRSMPSAPDGPIVVGVDGSATARGALQWAIAEARAQRCPVVAVWTWHVSAPGAGDVYIHTDAASMEEATVNALEREVAQCESASCSVAIERRVVQGFPAAVLVEASRTASMVVVGSRGHRAATGLFLGSVSDQVAHHAEGPVIVVPPGALSR